ncbi:Hsp20/alpha crystallin family protein [Saliphagus infecundisoli]|uniref:Hsp20/alpha crystallin family protein n=1 Tax=Saliphagus infecundisoli TaxID=1849069 RepID=A0ABD5QI19_9EURY|nr:Hsp20/alpha crystallin family protein [Saliphagus infecundisoli]
MNIQQLARDDGQMVRQYAYEDSDVYAIDFGPAGDETTVDVADGTVIVVTGDDQREFDLPEDAGDAQAFMKNGVLTIELEEDR